MRLKVIDKRTGQHPTLDELKKEEWFMEGYIPSGFCLMPDGLRFIFIYGLEDYLFVRPTNSNYQVSIKE